MMTDVTEIHGRTSSLALASANFVFLLKSIRFVSTIGEDFEESKGRNHPISVVFITNAKGFKISKLSGKRMLGTEIQRRHVDNEGTLLINLVHEDGQVQENLANKSIQKDLDALLLQNVSVKFIFLQQDAN